MSAAVSASPQSAQTGKTDQFLRSVAVELESMLTLQRRGEIAAVEERLEDLSRKVESAVQQRR